MTDANANMKTTLERYLSEQGWCGVDLPVVMVEVALAYLAARLDASPVRRYLDGKVGDDTPSMEDCQRVLLSLFDEADRVGLVRLLARPGSRDADDAILAFENICGDRKGEHDCGEDRGNRAF